MKHYRVLLCLLPLWACSASTVWAEVYRCVQPSGAVLYADEPCSKGERGGQVNIQPLVLDSKEGRERNQKALDEFKQRKAADPADEDRSLPEVRSGAALPPTGADRLNRLDQCEPLLDQASGVRRQAIGALCGADIDDALFDSCLAKVQAADSTGEMEALVRACTGSGLGSGAVVVPTPVYRRNHPLTHCELYPTDPACRKPLPVPLPVPDRMGPAPKPPKQPATPSDELRGWRDKSPKRAKPGATEDTDRH